MADYFNKDADYYKTVPYDSSISNKTDALKFSKTDLNIFTNYEEAYHQLMFDIIEQQIRSTTLVLQGTQVKKIFVDGGFGKNPVYMNLLAKAFPAIKVYAAAMPQASAIGAALAIHKHWNKNQLPSNIIELKQYANTEMNYSQ